MAKTYVQSPSTQGTYKENACIHRTLTRESSKSWKFEPLQEMIEAQYNKVMKKKLFNSSNECSLSSKYLLFLTNHKHHMMQWGIMFHTATTYLPPLKLNQPLKTSKTQSGNITFTRAAQDWEVGNLEEFISFLYSLNVRIQGRDTLSWKPFEKGIFSTHSNYKVLS